jgi:hypothetical protein
VEQLGGEGPGQAVDAGELIRSEGLARELLGDAGYFLQAERFCVEKKLLDSFGCGGLGEAVVVAVDFPADDGLGGFGFAAADGLVAGGDLLEVVDVVDEAAFDAVDVGGNVAGDGDVDEEDGAVAAALEEGAGVGDSEKLTCAGAGDDDVGAVGLLVDIVGVRRASAMVWARASVRLETRSVVAPCWMRWRAARSDILPAPTRSTVLPESEPKILRASSAATEAMETVELPIWVSERTRLATEKARWSRGSRMELEAAVDLTAPTSRATVQDCFTWPRIWDSPTTMESSELATRKRWRMASRSRNS